MISSRQLETVRKTIRKAVPLDPSDKLDLALIAATLANFDPLRESPVWFVVLSPPGSEAPDLISTLFASWDRSHALPDNFRPLYLKSALPVLERKRARILICRDMTTIYYRPKEIQLQLRGLHVGLYDSPKGFCYGIPNAIEGLQPIPPADRFGLLASATAERVFFEWQEENESLGSRFLAFRPAPRDELAIAKELPGSFTIRTSSAAHLDNAKLTLHNYLTSIASILPEESSRVAISRDDKASLAALCTLVRTARPIESPKALYGQILAILRISAICQGRRQIVSEDLDLARAIVLSQISRGEELALRYAATIEEGKTWNATNLEEWAERTTYVTLQRGIDSLVNARLLQVSKKKALGKPLYLSPHARELVELAGWTQKDPGSVGTPSLPGVGF